MNCVLGDPLESLLYKIFVSLDERTPVNELSTVLQVIHSKSLLILKTIIAVYVTAWRFETMFLQVEPQLIKNAVSIYCRLGFAHKKNLDKMDLHPSWKAETPQPSMGTISKE